MAEVPFPTLHVPHTHARATGQADGQVGRVCLLLTGSGLHVAGVPGWAAVLTVLTAHSMRQLAAGPASTQAWAAGLSHGAAGVLVTAYIPAVRWGSPAGRHLLQSTHHLAPPLTVPVVQARIAMGQQCWWSEQQTASGAGQQPHSPDISRQQVLEEGQLVTLSQGTSFSVAWGSAAEGGLGPAPSRASGGVLFTGALRCVTFKPSRAAVYMVLTAYGLGKRAAAPGP